MKNIVLLSFIVAATMGMNAQKFNVGLSGGLPIGDASDITTFGINLDPNYLFAITELLDIGVASGYHHYFGEEIEGGELDDTGFIPLAVAGRVNLSEVFTLGLDLGYAVGISPDTNDGGFYYAPRAQYGITKKLDFVLAYKAINLDNFDFGVITLGLEYGF